MKQLLIKLIPDFLKPSLKKIYYFSINLFDRLTMDPNGMIPPRSEIFVGSGNFEQIGNEFKKYFIELVNLDPNAKVLDVGCGIGRMAIPLTSYLTIEGGYWGFDIVKKGIDWCQNRITPKFTNFHFVHTDVYNKEYNPNGQTLAKDFKFPFENEFFDFIFLTSVFTHMLPLDLENYLSEISRVLKRDGKCLITFFLLNEESLNLIHNEQSTIDFKYEIEDCLTANESCPEAAIAYHEERVKSLFQKYGLSIIPPIHYGNWCNRSNFLSYQDIIVLQKTN